MRYRTRDGIHTGHDCSEGGNGILLFGLRILNNFLANIPQVAVNIFLELVRGEGSLDMRHKGDISRCPTK